MKFLQVIFVFAMVCNMFTFQNAAPTTPPATTETKAAETNSSEQDVQTAVITMVGNAAGGAAKIAAEAQALKDNKSATTEERAKAITGMITTGLETVTKTVTEAISLNNNRRQRQEAAKKNTK